MNQERPYVLALDLGASSGRAILVHYDGQQITLEEVYRFDNMPIQKNEKLYWDVDALFSHIQTGMIKAYQKHPFVSVGIDTWGVDYGLLDAKGNLVDLPRHYRDPRTNSDHYVRMVRKQIPDDTLYERSGIQLMPINSLYQLLDDKQNPTWKCVHHMLFMPDLFAYKLTGCISAERSIASTSQMLLQKTGGWDMELLQQMQIPASILPPIAESGSIKGTLSPEIQNQLQLPPVPVIAICEHDTQCAAFAAPAQTPSYAFLSCGTWSLFGTVSDQPCLTSEAAHLGWSNEIGYNKQVTFLKNITGLWLIQESRRFYAKQGQSFQYDQIEQMASHCHIESIIDPNDPVFMPEGNIPERVQAYCRNTNQVVPQTPAEIFRCIYQSLALTYRIALEELESCMQNTYDALYLLGGGVKDQLLCQLTADACQIPVLAGPVEATVYGNGAIQLIASGAIASAEEAHRVIAASANPQTYTPGEFPRHLYDCAQHNLRA